MCVSLCIRAKLICTPKTVTLHMPNTALEAYSVAQHVQPLHVWRYSTHRHYMSGGTAHTATTCLKAQHVQPPHVLRHSTHRHYMSGGTAHAATTCLEAQHTQPPHVWRHSMLSLRMSIPTKSCFLIINYDGCAQNIWCVVFMFSETFPHTWYVCTEDRMKKPTRLIQWVTIHSPDTVGHNSSAWYSRSQYIWRYQYCVSISLIRY